MFLIEETTDMYIPGRTVANTQSSSHIAVNSPINEYPSTNSPASVRNIVHVDCLIYASKTRKNTMRESDQASLQRKTAERERDRAITVKHSDNCQTQLFIFNCRSNVVTRPCRKRPTFLSLTYLHVNEHHVTNLLRQLVKQKTNCKNEGLN